MEDFLGRCDGLEGEQLLLHGVDPDRALLGNDAPLLERPGILDHVPRVVAQEPAEVLPVGRGVVGDVFVERREGGGLASDIGAGVGHVLVGGDGDQAEQEAVEHAEAGEHVADDVVGAGRVLDELPQQRPEEDTARPVEADEGGDE